MDDPKNLQPANAGERQVFSPEFKAQAVARLKAGASASTLARELGLRRNQLYKWSQQLAKAGNVPLKGVGRPPVEKEDELSRLRRENERLRMENTILKKADAYFARRKP
jgi:transposase